MGSKKESRPRIAIGPMNMAGQATAWCDALKRERNYDAVSFAASGFVARTLIPGLRLIDRPHASIPRRRLSPEAFRRWRIARLLDDFDCVIGESYVDMELLDPSGMILHGSEIRDPDLHMSWYPNSYFKVADVGWVDACRATVANNREMLGMFPTFVSTPDLLVDCPDATWLPLSIDVDRWRLSSSPRLGNRPRVLHVPSRRVPPIKGTSFIDPVMTDLAAAGFIEYVAPKMIPHHRMVDALASIDILVDQLLTGSYGVAAIEGMAAGRLVIGNVAPRVRRLLPEDVPIVDATPETLRELMVDIAERPEHYAAVAARGPVFAALWHGGTASARILADFADRAGPGKAARGLD